jgi:hypothetical protein
LAEHLERYPDSPESLSIANTLAIALMISSSIIAKQRRCLRRQLREVLWKSWLNSYSQTPQNAFFSSAARLQEDPQFVVEEKPAVLKTETETIPIEPGIVVRRESNFEEGRIVGRRGRRQQVVSKRITRNSLDKPSYVVVFRDVDEDDKPSYSAQVRTAEPSTTDKPASANEGQHIITLPLKPTAEETNASIDALRPAAGATIIDKAGYKRLLQTLLTSYNTVQLRDYLIHSFSRLNSFPSHISSQETVDDDIESQSIGQWQAGQTPLEQRHKPKVLKKANAARKKRFADNILRFAWQVIVTSEESKVGELEFAVKPWQLRVLFDLETEGKARYRSLLASDILVQNSEIRPYRPDNIVRVTARRQDAEDIARRLRRALFSVNRLEFDLKPFSSLLGQHGWPTQLDALYHNNDLKFVSDTTGALIEREVNDVIVIYSFDLSAENDARRLLLAHLKKPVPTSYNHIIDLIDPSPEFINGKRRASELIAMPCDPDNDHLNRSHRHSNLVRMVKPLARRKRDASDPLRTKHDVTTDSNDVSASETFAATIGQALQTVQPYSQGTNDIKTHAESYWGKSIRLRSQNWRAHLCKLLRPVEKKRDSQSRNRAESLIPVYEAPGVERLISYFDDHQQLIKKRLIPRRNSHQGGRYINNRIDSRVPNLVACFVPSPFTHDGGEVLTRLPTIELRFRVADPSETVERGSRYAREDLQLYGVRAVLDQQLVAVPLPDKTVDVLFSRPTLMFADRRAILENSDIALFIRKLREMFLAGGALSATPELSFLLPQWLVKGEKPSADSAQQPDVPVQYLFDRFEQIQAFNLEPIQSRGLLKQLDFEDRDVIENIPKECHLEFRQVEGSIIHGKETSLNVRLEAGSRVNATTGRKAIAQNEGQPDESGSEVSSRENPTVDAAARSEDASTTTSINDQIGDTTGKKSLLEVLALSALDVAHLLTRANAGAIPVPNSKRVLEMLSAEASENENTNNFSAQEYAEDDAFDDAEGSSFAAENGFAKDSEALDDEAIIAQERLPESDAQALPASETTEPNTETAEKTGHTS